VPQGEEELRVLYMEFREAGQRRESAIEEAEREQFERARQEVSDLLQRADFSWMERARLDGWANPKQLPNLIFYDFTRGTPRSQAGIPLKMQVCVSGRADSSAGVEKWAFHRLSRGACSVPCAMFAGSCYLLIHPPMRRNGNGLHLNQYTLTLSMRFGAGPEASPSDAIFERGLMATGGWDDLCPAVEGALDAQLLMDDDGGLGAHEVFGSKGGPRVQPERWQTISCTVDAVGGVMTTYVDGELVASICSADVCKDGQHALRHRLALFYMKDQNDCDPDELDALVTVYLRSVTVHSRALDAAQVKQEHATVHSLLIADAIASAPTFLQPVLKQQHATTPMTSHDAVSKTVLSLLREADVSVAQPLWAALYARDEKAVDELIEGMQPHHVAICARWRCRDQKTNAIIEHDESTPPFGETLLHMAAYVGHACLIERLLAAGARPARAGSISGCSALHAAAAADQPDWSKPFPGFRSG